MDLRQIGALSSVRRSVCGLALTVLCAVCAPGVGAGGDIADSQQHLRDAQTAYEAGDFDRFRTELEAAHALNPASYYTRYNLACAYALTGDADRALDLLEQLARARVDFGIADDDDLASLREQPRFRTLLPQVRAATQPEGRSRLRWTFDELGLIPEGIAWDAGSERLFFGSMRTGEIFVIDRHEQLARFAAVRRDKPLAAIGMTVDRARELLWVVGTQFFLTEEFDDTAPAWTGVFGFDLASGALRHEYLRDDIPNGYNDVTLGPGGDLYLSGSTIGVVPAGGDAILDLETDADLFGSNGIAATPDGKWLLTSSYPVGIAVIRLADGAVHFLESPEDVPLYGIDGMYWHDGDLLAVQNGVRPWRLVRLQLDDALTAVTAATVIEIANPDMTATTAAIVGDTIVHIGQAPAPANPPSHYAKELHRDLGKTVIMTAPLD